MNLNNSASSFPCSTEYRQLICADTLGESPLECTRAYLGNVDVIFLQCESTRSIHELFIFLITNAVFTRTHINKPENFTMADNKMEYVRYRTLEHIPRE